MLSLNYHVQHEYNQMHRSTVTATKGISTIEKNICSNLGSKPFQDIYSTDTYLDDEDDDITILFNGKNDEGYEDRVSLYHNTCLRYADVAMAGPPVQALNFPKPIINRAMHCDARVLDHRSGRVQESTIIMKLMSDDQSDYQRTDRAYLVRRKLSKSTLNGSSSSIRLCTVLRRRMTTYEGRIHNRNSTTAEWKTTDEHVVIKVSPLQNTFIHSKPGGRKPYDDNNSNVNGITSYNRNLTKTSSTSRNDGLFKGTLFLCST
jgi:hypothetical protein